MSEILNGASDCPMLFEKTWGSMFWKKGQVPRPGCSRCYTTKPSLILSFQTRLKALCQRRCLAAWQLNWSSASASCLIQSIQQKRNGKGREGRKQPGPPLWYSAVKHKETRSDQNKEASPWTRTIPIVPCVTCSTLCQEQCSAGDVHGSENGIVCLVAPGAPLPWKQHNTFWLGSKKYQHLRPLLL